MTHQDRAEVSFSDSHDNLIVAISLERLDHLPIVGEYVHLIPVEVLQASETDRERIAPFEITDVMLSIIIEKSDAYGVIGRPIYRVRVK